MDQEKLSKTGIFNLLKQRFWNRTNSSCFNGVVKRKTKSESCYCNYISSTGEGQDNIHENCDTIPNSPRLGHMNGSVSESALSNLAHSSTTHPESITNINNLCKLNAITVDDSLHSPLPDETTENTQPGTNTDSLSEYLVNSGAIYDYLMSERMKLSKYGWYWGSISKEEADEKLSNQPDGSFLLRDSSNNNCIVSLTFRSSGKTLHTRIQYRLKNGRFTFYQQEEEYFATVVELIEHYRTFSKSAVCCYSRPSLGHAAFPFRLIEPISRFAHVQSLQHMCRFIIRQSVNLENIQKLPLPNEIKLYLKKDFY